MINSIHYFRAIAITFIVSGHSFMINKMVFDDIYTLMIKNFISGGTCLFVFISGFLFYEVFYDGFDFWSFVKKKVKNILIPYLLLGFLPVVIFVYKKVYILDGYFLPNGSGFFLEYAIPFIKYFLTGAFFAPYWFVPFVILMFFLSPMHVFFIRLTFFNQLTLVFILSIVAMLVHRPLSNINPMHSLVYFTPIYFIGIMASMYRLKLYYLFKGRELILFTFAIFITYIQSSYGSVGSYHKDFFAYSGLDLMFLQKVMLSLFFTIWLHRFEHTSCKTVSLIADTSFAIYFIHPLVLWFLRKVDLGIFQTNSWLYYFLFVFNLVVFCMILSTIVKNITPRYSRIIIGY
ncbi:acyltransferase [Vibrio caribbeanicus]|uniref:Acyltransferase n=1 Tax=Vibrio caribbeanicus TaxID=701175 RepID=A0ACC4NZI2_9VIBR|nr:acyltransferase [Vibrio caribbeanicus]KHD25910.1 acyltransferase [Vibrio caribbeanicus]